MEDIPSQHGPPISFCWHESILGRKFPCVIVVFGSYKLISECLRHARLSVTSTSLVVTLDKILVTWVRGPSCTHPVIVNLSSLRCVDVDDAVDIVAPFWEDRRNTLQIINPMALCRIRRTIGVDGSFEYESWLGDNSPVRGIWWSTSNDYEVGLTISSPSHVHPFCIT